MNAECLNNGCDLEKPPLTVIVFSPREPVPMEHFTFLCHKVL